MYYTEYLPRLNSISIVLGQTCALEKIKGILINNKNQVLINFEANQNAINLPVPVEENEQIRITSVNQTQDCLQITISLSKESSAGISEKTESFMTFSSSNLNQKWSCMDLKNKTPKVNNTNKFKLCCSQCSHEIIDSTKYDKFFDMPSELWSEMMEFWHCHKPAEPTQNHSHRNYNGGLKPNTKDVIIGSYYFLVNKSSQLQVSDYEVKCPQCKLRLGQLDNSIMKILKWNLLLKYGNQTEIFPSYIYVYNLIVDKINSSALRKFKITSESMKDYMFVWVMNIGVNVSTDQFILNNALKVFYYVDEVENMSNDEDESIESLVLLDNVFMDFQSELGRLNNNIPSSKKSITLKIGEEVKFFNISFIRST